jgi:cobalt-zinc-cadmium efflux system membrane fusion protein
MATEQLPTFLRRLRGIIASRTNEGVSDAELLERFVGRRDESAFEVLVRRYGGLVFNVCARLLRRAEDTEDVFQATFLALACKAGAIRRGESLGSWLYKVAYRGALRVRSGIARKRECMLTGLDLPSMQAGNDPGPDLRSVLDAEINDLPEKYRVPVVLCYLEGKTTEEAARQLCCPRGTVCSRLSWARRRLRNRLVRRGLTLSAVALAEALAPSPAPAALVSAAVDASVLFVSGQAAAGALPGSVVALTEGVLRAMLLAKLKTVAAVVFVVGLLGAGAGLCLERTCADRPGSTGVPVLVRGSGDGVRLPPEATARMGVKLTEVKTRDTAPTRVLAFSGSLALDPERLNRVRCRFAPAEVVEIGKTTGEAGERELRAGDRVGKGQVLAVLFSVEVTQKKSDLLSASVQLRLDEMILERAEKAAKDGAVPEVFLLNARRTAEADRSAVSRARNTLLILGVPQEDIDAVLKEAEKVGKHKPDPDRDRRWGRVELRAPDDGVLIERNLTRNEIVPDITHNLFQIARLGRLKVVVEIPRDMSQADLVEALKRPWTIRTSDGREGTVRLDSISLSPDRPSAVVSGLIDNPEGHWRAGQLITASVTLPLGLGEMVLPASAIVEEGGQTFVFVQPDAKKSFFEQRRVEVVRRGHDAVHIRSRLSAEQERQGLQTVRRGERVVTAGAIELKAILADLKSREE